MQTFCVYFQLFQLGGRKSIHESSPVSSKRPPNQKSPGLTEKEPSKQRQISLTKDAEAAFVDSEVLLKLVPLLEAWKANGRKEVWSLVCSAL